MSTFDGRYPYEAAVTAYGNGGFRFAEMSHKGSILCLPTGVFAWPPVDASALTLADFDRVFADLQPPCALLLGTGGTQMFMSADIERGFVSHGISLEPMSTGAAARTYNIMIAEKRRIGAALLAVA
ncbi:MAG: hypothetical protein IKE66_07670 [Hyphomicrobium sp.]|nr:hypothetical protein [Hyphomicrobium sp.]